MFVLQPSSCAVLSLSCCSRANLCHGRIGGSDVGEFRGVERQPPRRDAGALLASAFLLCVAIKWRAGSAPAFLPDPDGLWWESSSWEEQREELTEHLRQGGLHQDSVHRGFTLDDQNALLQWSNLQPSCWAPEQDAEDVPPVDCPGYYQVTILGKEVTASCGLSSQPELVWVLQGGRTCTFYETLLGNCIL